VTLEAQLREIAQSADLAAIGFCSADPFAKIEQSLREAVRSGRSGSLGFTFSDPATASDPRASFDWAASLVSVAYAYLPQGGRPPDATEGVGRVARFATEDHYVALRSALDLLCETLVSEGYRAEVLCDDSRLVDRAAAVRAGIAWWGKSTMALAPGSGPWMLLGSVVTDAALTSDEPMQRDCGLCSTCIPACPTGAIVAPGVLDARRCLAAIAQSGGAIPIEFRQAMGDRVYGCDECLAACPPGERLAASATVESGGVDLLQMLAMADRPLRRRFAHFYVERNKARFLRRNAIVALGNAEASRFTGILAGVLGHPDSLLRAHAAWALGRSGDPVAAAALRAAKIAERTADVVAEIDAALVALGGDIGDVEGEVGVPPARTQDKGEPSVLRGRGQAGRPGR